MLAAQSCIHKQKLVTAICPMYGQVILTLGQASLPRKLCIIAPQTVPKDLRVHDATA